MKLLENRIVALGKLKKVPGVANRSSAAEKSRAILTSLVGAVAISRSIQSDEEIRRVLTAAQNQILTMLGVGELALSYSAPNPKDTLQL